MVRSNDDLEALLQKLDLRYEPLDDGTFLVGLVPDQSPVAVRVELPVVVLELRIGELPPGREAAVMRRLLELNASDLLHAAYGLVDNRIVLGAALEAETLDPGELEATLADMGLALSRHVPLLRQMATTQA